MLKTIKNDVVSSNALVKLLRHTAFAESVLLEIADDNTCTHFECAEGEVSVKLYNEEYTNDDGEVTVYHYAKLVLYSNFCGCNFHLFDVDLDTDERRNFSTVFSTYMAHYIECHC